MKKRLICLLVSVSAIFLSSTLPQRKTLYVDSAIIHNELFALTTAGSIDIYNIDTYLRIDTGIMAKNTILKLEVDRENRLIVIEKNGKSEMLDRKNLIFKPFQTTDSDLYNIVFNAKNEPFLVTANGIYDVKGGENYIPDSSFSLNKYVRQWTKPSAVYMAPNDCIWLGYAHGEWGGDLVVFNTNEKRFIKIDPGNFKIELNPLKSFFYANGDVYFSCGLNHFFSSGCIVRVVDFKCGVIFESNFYNKNDSTVVNGKYIGPAVFNEKNASFYFYCQYGIFSGEINKNLSDTSTWKKVTAPELSWEFGQSDAAGYRMNVLKMQVAPNGKLFLITQNNGIGVLDGRRFTLLN